MSENVTSLQDALSQVRDFRHPQGRRYQLQAVLALSCLAMLNGAQSEQAISTWSGNEGRRWMSLLGFRRQRGPSAATLHRIFRGIDRSQLETALDQWSRQALASNFKKTEAPLLSSESNTLNTMSLWADLVKAQLETGSELEHISDAGLKIWAIDCEPATYNQTISEGYATPSNH